MSEIRAYTWAWRLPSDPWGYRHQLRTIDSTGHLLRDLGNGWMQDTCVWWYTEAEREEQLKILRRGFPTYEIRFLPADET